MKCPKCSSLGAYVFWENHGQAKIYCNACGTETLIPFLDSVLLSMLEGNELAKTSWIIKLEDVIEYSRNIAKEALELGIKYQNIANYYSELADSLEKLLTDIRELKNINQDG